MINLYVKNFLLNFRICFSLINIWFKKLDIFWLDEGFLVSYVICFLMIEIIYIGKNFEEFGFIKKFNNCMKYNIEYEFVIMKIIK